MHDNYPQRVATPSLGTAQPSGPVNRLGSDLASGHPRHRTGQLADPPHAKLIRSSPLIELLDRIRSTFVIDTTTNFVDTHQLRIAVIECSTILNSMPTAIPR